MRPVEIELMASVEGEHWWYRGLRNVIGRSLLRPNGKIPPRPRILDAGCGTGENLLFLKRLLQPAYIGGFDLSPVAVSHSRAKVPAADVYQSDIRDPEIHATDLDLILSCDVLSIAGIRESIAGLKRLVERLRRGGYLIVNLPAFAWLRSRHDVATDTRDRVTAGQTRELLKELGLTIEVISYRLCFLLPPIVLARLPSMLRRPWVHGAGAQSAAAGSDLRLAPKWINPLLYPLLHAENAAIVRGMRFPWGSRCMPLPESHDAVPARETDESGRSSGEFFRGRRVLITGGLGFLGSNLATRLVGCGAKVTLLDSLAPHGGGSFHNIAPIRDQVAVNISDMRDAHSLGILVQDKDFIFNLAGQVSHGDSMRDPKLDLDCNCVSTLNLVEACRKLAPEVRLLYSSTRQVYGHPRHLPVGEDHPALPIDINGIHKLAAEQYHLLYDSVYGVRSTVLRLTNTYGPRQKICDDRQGVAAVFLHQALCGQPIEVYGGGRQRRDFTFVDDVVEAMLRAMIHPCCLGKVFNLGATTAHSLLQFLEILREHCTFDVRCVPFPTDKKIIDIGDYYGDYSAFHGATGWEPKIGLEEGLRRTIAFYRENRGGYW